MTRVIALLAAAALAAACGGPGTKPRITSQGPREAPKLDPVKPAAMKEFEAALRALRLAERDATATARARLEAAVEIDPTLWEAWHDLGVIAGDDGDDDAAVRAFGRALDVNPAHTPSRLARAEAHRRAGRTKDARADYEASLREFTEDDPLRVDAAARLASLLRDAGAHDDAVEVLRDTLRVAGPSSRVYTELGQIYLAQRRHDMAKLVIARAIELDAKDPAAYNALALLYLSQGKAQEAFDRFDYATSLDPAYLDARFNKAAVLLDAGDYQRAKQELSIIVEQAPDDLAAHVALGVALRGLKDLQGAKKIWDEVVADAPRRAFARADALYNLAILKAFFLEDVPGAKADLERYMQDAPTSHPRRQDAEAKRKELGL